MPTISVTSLVGLMTREPLVQMEWTDEASEGPPRLHRIQMSTEEAQSVAYDLVVAAEASIHDLWLTEFMIDRVGMDMDRVGMFLMEFRRFRDARLAALAEEGERGAHDHR